MRRTRLVIAGLVVALLAEAVLYAVLLRHTELGRHPRHAQLLAATALPVWAVTVFLLSRLALPRRVGVTVVLGAGLVFGVLALTHEPTTSDDDYRYMWDAKVQLAGTDPYRYPPAAPQVARLRDPSLFGPPDHCRHFAYVGCTSINRPFVRTVYPPVAQAAFTLMRLLSFGGHGNHLPLQIFALLGCLAVGALLLRRGPPWRAAVWTWCPVVVVEYANNAHIDWLAALLVVVAFVVARRTWVVGVLIGAAVAVKIYPALVLPALMRRNWLVAVVAAAFVALVYVPHVLAVGADVIGYLPGYLSEEQYGSGQRLLLLGEVLPHPADTVVGVAIVAAVALWAWWRARVGVEAAAVVVVGVTFCVFTPSYGWYAGLLIALVALTGAIEWIPIAVAPTFTYLVHSEIDSQIYALALLLTVLAAAVRYRVSRRPRRAAPDAGSASRPERACGRRA